MQLAPAEEPVVAVRIDGTFRDLRLRSVHAQREPYPPLREVVAHQTEWAVASDRGTGVRGSLWGSGSPTPRPASRSPAITSTSSPTTARPGATSSTSCSSKAARVSTVPTSCSVEVPEGLALGEPGGLTSEIAAVEGDHGRPR